MLSIARVRFHYDDQLIKFSDEEVAKLRDDMYAFVEIMIKYIENNPEELNE